MFGIGVDICEVKRFEKFLTDRHFLERIFTADEIRYCGNKKGASQCFAARFAAKEAFVKALGTGMGKGVHLNEIEIKKDKKGKPFFNISGETFKTLKEKTVGNIYLSISHEKQNAIAFVIIE